jgi:hypothetical protein
MNPMIYKTGQIETIVHVGERLVVITQLDLKRGNNSSVAFTHEEWAQIIADHPAGES